MDSKVFLRQHAQRTHWELLNCQNKKNETEFYFVANTQKNYRPVYSSDAWKVIPKKCVHTFLSVHWVDTSIRLAAGCHVSLRPVIKHSLCRITARPVSLQHRIQKPVSLLGILKLRSCTTVLSVNYLHEKFTDLALNATIKGHWTCTSDFTYMLQNLNKTSANTPQPVFL